MFSTRPSLTRRRVLPANSIVRLQEARDGDLIGHLPALRGGEVKGAVKVRGEVHFNLVRLLTGEGE